MSTVTLQNLEEERCKLISTGLATFPLFFDFTVRSPGFSWDDSFLPNGQLLHDMSETYNYDTMYDDICGLTTIDTVCCGTSTVQPLLFHWGDVAGANANADRALALLREIGADFCASHHMKHMLPLMVAMFHWMQILPMLGRDADAVELMKEMEYTPETGESGVDLLITDWMRARGASNDAPDGKLFSQDALHLQACAFYTLASGDPAGLDSILPLSPDAMAELGAVGFPSRPFNLQIAHSFGAMTWPAMAFERCGMAERALAFAGKSLEADLAKGGNTVLWTRALAHSCRGRVLAGLGRRSEASGAFEAGLAEIHGALPGSSVPEARVSCEESRPPRYTSYAATTTGLLAVPIQ